MADVLLGADVGTSALKLVAIGPGGDVVAEAEASYAVAHPIPGHAETEVRVWRQALDDALGDVGRSLGGARVRALGLAGQMHGVVLVDDAGAALRPALLWPDRRAGDELAAWRALPPDDRAALANPVVPGMTGPMLAWLARHEPRLVSRAAAALLPKDALRATLLPGTDPRVTDRSDASATLLWDIPADGWSDAAVAAAGIPGSLLPAVRPSTEVVGTATLPMGEVPVVVGAADTPSALLAAGTPVGSVQINMGTGVQLLRPGVRPRPVAEPLVHTCADAEGGWYAMAALENGGSAWAWVRDVLGMSWAELFDASAASRPGAGGVVFRPFLAGERGGVAGPDDRGGWSGLSSVTTRADLARAAVEGVLFAVAAALELLGGPDAGAPVVLTGGGGRSAVVQQLLADVLGRPVRYRRRRSASAVGAAVLAGRGIGVDVVPERAGGRAVDPRTSADLAAAAARWRGTGVPGVGTRPSVRAASQ